MEFNIRVYAANPQQTEKVIELQRRSGCSLAFNYFYSQFIEHMKSIVDRPFCHESICATSLQQPSTPEGAEPHSPNSGCTPLISSQQTCDKELLSMLCAMSNTNDVAVQREAIQAISRCSFDEDMNSSQDDDCGTCPGLNQQDNLVRVLGDILQANKHDTEQVRCVAVAIHALAMKCESIRPKLLERFSDSIYSTLACVASTRKPCLQLQATKRHIIESLSLCLQTHSSQLAHFSHRSVGEWCAVLKQCMEVTEDERLKESYKRILKQINDAN